MYMYMYYIYILHMIYVYRCTIEGDEPVAILVEDSELTLGSLELLAGHIQVLTMGLSSALRICLRSNLVLEDLGIVSAHGLGVSHEFLEQTFIRLQLQHCNTYGFC